MSSSTEWGKMDSDPSDIVDRLRSVDGTKDAGFVIDLCREAAAEIERLRAALWRAAWQSLQGSSRRDHPPT